MTISQEFFARRLIEGVAAAMKEEKSSGKEPGYGVPDEWVVEADGYATSGTITLQHHGMFSEVYRKELIVPRLWKRFCAQFYTPEARLLMRLHQECQQPSWLTWSPDDGARDDFPMTRHFWTKKSQEETYVALCAQLRNQGIAISRTRSYANDPNAFGVQIKDRVIDFPGSYRVLECMVQELQTGEPRFQMDIPRGMCLYGERKPVLHMCGSLMRGNQDELTILIAEKSLMAPKKQHIVYTLSELYRGKFLPRRVGSMSVSAIEASDHGFYAGAVHSDVEYIVPNDLSEDEKRSLPASQTNWEIGCESIIEGCHLLRKVF